jgi:hypothetical protein
MVLDTEVKVVTAVAHFFSSIESRWRFVQWLPDLRPTLEEVSLSPTNLNLPSSTALSD